MNLPAASVALTVRPAALTPLGGDRFALLAFEDDATAAHAEPGAVAVAYLTHDGGRWRVLGVWPELAWTGNDGNAADAVVLERLGGRPLALLSSSYLGQGEATVSDWVIDLAPRAPSLLGRIPIAGSLASGCDRCERYDYQGHVGPAADAGALLSVRYTGWITPAEGKAPATVFTRNATFVLRAGKLEPTGPLSLPD